MKRRVLITGAAGRIGTAFRQRYGDRLSLRLVDRRPVPDPGEHEHYEADLVDLESAIRACEGVDTVLHLAADPSPRATFYDTLLPLNVQMTYNVFHAAVEQKCRRVLFASSIHAVNAYPLDYQIHPADPILPGDLYGVTKCWGEALCAYYASREGLSCIAIRIGAFGAPERLTESNDSRLLSLWVSHDDLSQLLYRCVEAPDSVRHLIVHGVSDNQLKRMDISNAREILGYEPKDNAFVYSAHTNLAPRRPNDPDV
ncbi:MAG: NAD(P)-dependent oxidoreductase [Armatimonadetes bacterium]|nr:NAD(P)-dependent oxidoreductase [Armatimonadota bacterium]